MREHQLLAELDEDHELWQAASGQLVALLTIHEHYPRDVRSAISIRRQAELSGRCPACSAEGEDIRDLRNHDPEVILRVVHWHHAGPCPATDEALRTLASRHGVRIGQWEP